MLPSLYAPRRVSSRRPLALSAPGLAGQYSDGELQNATRQPLLPQTGGPQVGMLPANPYSGGVGGNLNPQQRLQQANGLREQAAFADAANPIMLPQVDPNAVMSLRYPGQPTISRQVDTSRLLPGQIMGNPQVEDKQAMAVRAARSAGLRERADLMDGGQGYTRSVLDEQNAVASFQGNAAGAESMARAQGIDALAERSRRLLPGDIAMQGAQTGLVGAQTKSTLGLLPGQIAAQTAETGRMQAETGQIEQETKLAPQAMGLERTRVDDLQRRHDVLLRELDRARQALAKMQEEQALFGGGAAGGGTQGGAQAFEEGRIYIDPNTKEKYHFVNGQRKPYNGAGYMGGTVR